MDTVKSTEEQLKYIQLSGIPYSSIVFTGNKSLHVVIALDEAIPTLKLYKEIHQALCMKIANFADPATNRPSVTTKIPDCFRINKSTNLKARQKLIDIRQRVSIEDLFDFIQDELKVIHSRSLLKKSSSSTYSGSSDARELFEHYIQAIAGTKYHPIENFSTQCPLCHEEGSDRQKNNLSINLSGEKILVHCFANREHSYTAILTYLRKHNELAPT